MHEQPLQNIKKLHDINYTKALDTLHTDGNAGSILYDIFRRTAVQRNNFRSKQCQH